MHGAGTLTLTDPATLLLVVGLFLVMVGSPQTAATVLAASAALVGTAVTVGAFNVHLLLYLFVLIAVSIGRAAVLVVSDTVNLAEQGGRGLVTAIRGYPPPNQQPPVEADGGHDDQEPDATTGDRLRGWYRWISSWVRQQQ